MTDNVFLNCSSREILPNRPALLGCRLDETCTFTKGARKAPDAIRSASESIETYSPFLDLDLLDHPFADLGDIPFINDTVDSYLDKIQRTVDGILSKNASPLSLGGEHTITLPIVREVVRKYPDLFIVHLDAHSDLRDDYEGQRINHATVIRRIADFVDPKSIVQMGIRAGTREEFLWMRRNETLLHWNCGTEKRLQKIIGNRPVYLTLDLDVLDPSCFPSTGNPEPGGWYYRDMERMLWLMGKVNMVGADVVELNPSLDPSNVGAITAAKIVRELLLLLGKVAG